MVNVFVYPFDKTYLKDEGVTSPEMFREWVEANGDDFFYSQKNSTRGDIMIFAWKIEEGKWIAVGDAIVICNHDAKGCNPEAGLDRHILTGSIRLYPKDCPMTSQEYPEMGPFLFLKPEQYGNLMARAISSC